MDDLIASFNSLGVSSDVILLINNDMHSMALHYIQGNKETLPEYSPNLIYDYNDNDELNQEILSYINKNGEAALVDAIFSINKSTFIDSNDISTYITYYVSLLEIAK